MRRLARTTGQASVELVAFLPLMVGLGFALFSVISAAAARELAAQAAEAGAIALLQDRDPRAAARAALPDDRSGATIEVERRRVAVTVRPRGPIGRLNEALDRPRGGGGRSGAVTVTDRSTRAASVVVTATAAAAISDRSTRATSLVVTATAPPML